MIEKLIKCSFGEAGILDGATRAIKSDSISNFLFLQGKYHATDRAMQMELLRIIAQGRICECLDDTDDNLKIDIFMRQMGFYHYAKIEASKFSNEEVSNFNQYLEGVNSVFTKKTPFEFKLVGHRPTSWKIEDVIVTIKLMSYLGLGQGQQDLEKFIIELIHGDADIDKVKKLFSPNLDGIDDDIIHLIKKLNIFNQQHERNSILSKLPKIQASNNWIISGKINNTHPIHASDPHLDCNRLPSVWYEIKALVNGDSYFGITMPGVPGIVMGRINDHAFSFTYGFMDMIDHFIEEVKDNRYREESDFINLEIRKEYILRKKNLQTEVFIKSTPNGVIEDDITEKRIKDGHYLSVAWSARKDGARETLNALYSVLKSRSALDVKEVLKDVCISCNWLINDNDNIFYQQSGLLPKRQNSGLWPLRGYKTGERWQGVHGKEVLLSQENPECGYIVTANDRITENQNPLSINSPMGSYRKDIITKLIKDSKEHSVEQTKEIQNSLYSLQAKYYVEKYKHCFESNEFTKSLASWDFNYTTESKEAVIFEQFYSKLISLFLEENFLSKEGTEKVMNDSTLVIDYYDYFDQILLSDKDSSFWFKNDELDKLVLKAISSIQTNNVRWGEINRFKMKNIFFDGKLPKFLGFDIPNIEVPGNRATVVQGAVFKAHGRDASFCPSWRFITDLKSSTVYSNIPGGLSDRRFSKYYKTDVDNWIKFKYRENKIDSF